GGARLRGLPVTIGLLRFLFFHCYGTTAELYPFPTRRSSDLCRIPLLRPLFVRFLSRPLRTNSSNEAPDSAPRIPPVTFSGIAGRDRKSTRLNSSHDQISYAVSCLKKKNHSSPILPRFAALQH